LIVGQSIMCDIEWMKLEKDVHYSDIVDLGDQFMAYDPIYRNNK